MLYQVCDSARRASWKQGKSRLHQGEEVKNTRGARPTDINSNIIRTLIALHSHPRQLPARATWSRSTRFSGAAGLAQQGDGAERNCDSDRSPGVRTSARGDVVGDRSRSTAGAVLYSRPAPTCHPRSAASVSRRSSRSAGGEKIGAGAAAVRRAGRYMPCRGFAPRQIPIRGVVPPRLLRDSIQSDVMWDNSAIPWRNRDARSG